MSEISRRSFLAAPAVLPQAAAAAPAGPRPNVVIFLADDLGWNDVGYQGSEITTPHIDRLAGEGVRFNQFYSYPVCSPTRSGLLTGRSPMRYGMIYTVLRPWAPYGLPVDENIMPQTFKALGYQTAMVGKWHLGHARAAHLPHSRGFDHFYGHVNGAIDYLSHDRDGAIDWQRNGKTVREPGYSTDLLAAEAVRLIRERDRARPLFLYAAFNAPHTPLMAPKELIAKYAKIADERRRTYAAMVDSLDGAIGKVVAALEEAGISDNTLVLFLSDNGGNLSAGGRNLPYRAGKGTVFEGGIRVPALMRWRGHLPAGHTFDTPATVLDILPTLAAAAGGKPFSTKPLDGKDLWPVIGSGGGPREDLYFAIETERDRQWAVRRGQWKFVERIARADLKSTRYLFDLEADPLEKSDLSAANRPLVQELAAGIAAWRSLHPPCDLLSSMTPHPGWIPPRDWAEAALP